MSNLIFASSRCGNLPEPTSQIILFAEHYGSEFITTNVELLPGNSVEDKVLHFF